MNWTSAAISALERAVADDLTSGEIAEFLGWSKDAVTSKCRRAGFKLNGGRGNGDRLAQPRVKERVSRGRLRAIGVPRGAEGAYRLARRKKFPQKEAIEFARRAG